jgi:hypothetical protein
LNQEKKGINGSTDSTTQLLDETSNNLQPFPKRRKESGISVDSPEETLSKVDFMVPYPKNKEYVGISKVRAFMEGNS